MPKLAKNLLSVPAMAQMGAEVVFNKDECIILKDSRKLTLGHIVDKKLYRVNTSEFANVSTVSKEPTMRQWHCRYGHLNFDYVNQLMNKQLVEGLKCSDTDFDKQCEACVLGKMKKIPFAKQTVHRATELLELVHSDVCGPMNVDSLGGSRCMVTFIDDYSRYTFVYLLRSKDEVLTNFREFVNLVQNQTGQKVKTLNLRIKT